MAVIDVERVDGRRQLVTRIGEEPQLVVPYIVTLDEPSGDPDEILESALVPQEGQRYFDVTETFPSSFVCTQRAVCRIDETRWELKALFVEKG